MRGRFIYSTRDTYPPFRVDLTVLFSKELVRYGWSIDWHMPGTETINARRHVINAQETAFLAPGKAESQNKGFMNYLNGLWHDLWLGALVMKGSYLFVQVRDNTLAAVAALLAARLKKIPFVYWMSFPFCEADLDRAHDPGLVISRFRRLAYSIRGRLCSVVLYRLVLPRADHIFVQSEQMKLDVTARGITDKRMTVVPMGVDIEACDAAESQKIERDPRLQGKKVLLYVGTLFRVRRIDFLIRVLTQVGAQFDNAVLVLVGDAPPADMEFLRLEAQAAGLKEKVIFTGFIAMEQAWSYIRQADVCLSPFRPIPILNSTSPTKIIEYLAFGRPVVANDHPEQTRVLKESGGGYAVPYTEHDFAEAIVRLLENPQLVAEMGKAGQAYVRERRAYRRIAEKVDKVYRTLTPHGVPGST